MSKNQNKTSEPGPYVNPPNEEQILTRMRNLATVGEVFNLVNEIFPNWIIAMLPGFCTVYHHLKSNWLEVCSKIEVHTTEVMIVQDFPPGDDYTLVHHFCECFTRAGFAVRRKYEFIPCGKCKRAVPTEVVWGLFKSQGVHVPEEWSNKCSLCFS